jgi:hypothetical protein
MERRALWQRVLPFHPSLFIFHTSIAAVYPQLSAFSLLPTAFCLPLPGVRSKSGGRQEEIRLTESQPIRPWTRGSPLTRRPPPGRRTVPTPAGPPKPRTGPGPRTSLGLPRTGLRADREESPDRSTSPAPSPSSTSTACVKSRAGPQTPLQEQLDFRRQVPLSDDRPDPRTLRPAQAQPPQNILFRLIFLILLSAAQNAIGKSQEKNSEIPDHCLRRSPEPEAHSWYLVP